MRFGFFYYNVWYSRRREQFVITDQFLREVTWMSVDGSLLTRGRRIPSTFEFIGRL